MPNKKNMIGMQFGKLQVIGDGERPGYALCQCECGTIKEIRRTSLTKSNQPTRSCGCNQVEKSKQIGENVGKKNLIGHKKISREFRTDFDIITSQKLYKTNTTGYKGVSFNKEHKKYEAYISIQRKRIKLGFHNTLEEAVEARRKAEEKYFLPLIREKDMLEC